MEGPTVAAGPLCRWVNSLSNLNEQCISVRAKVYKADRVMV